MALAPADLPLRDIHLPPPVGWWPLAAGWWMVIGTLLLILLSALVCAWLRRKAQHQAFRRTALIELARLEQSTESSSLRIQKLSVLLRRVCLTIYPREEVAGLSGGAWLQKLDETLGDGRFSNGPGRILQDGPYRDLDTDDLSATFALCRKWLERVGRLK